MDLERFFRNLVACYEDLCWAAKNEGVWGSCHDVGLAIGGLRDCLRAWRDILEIDVEI